MFILRGGDALSKVAVNPRWVAFMPDKMKYMLIAGEASGDLHASHLIASLMKYDKDAEFRFLGGDLMAKVTRRSPEIHYEQMNVMGFSEVFRMLPRIMSNLKRAKQVLREFHPDVLILVDYPGFNLKLAKYAYKLGIRTDYYISPKIWAWKEYRIKAIKKYITSLYSILPFEEAFYKKHGFAVKYVGNPSVQEIDHALGHLPPLKHFIERQGISDFKPMIALLPGSRKGEIRNNLPIMIEAAKKFPDFQYVVAAAPTVPEHFYREVAQDPGLQLAFGATPTLLKYSKAALVTSGTATLETALIGTPQVVCYRGNGSSFTYRLMKKILKVNYVSLPNLIAGNGVVPEVLLHFCTPERLARELSPLLQPSPKREWQIQGYRTVKKRLGNSVASDYAAELITESLGIVIDNQKPDKPDKTNKNESQPRPKKQSRKE